MQGAIDVLDEFGVPYEVRIVSAHRTPDVMVEYARTRRRPGPRVIIAGAGGAAHLPGMTASMTPLPVIGVPVPLAQLDGLDSLLSIVQMPTGIPVATVADRQRPQRRPARGADPGGRTTTRSAPEMEEFATTSRGGRRREGRADPRAVRRLTAGRRGAGGRSAAMWPGAARRPSTPDKAGCS